MTAGTYCGDGLFVDGVLVRLGRDDVMVECRLAEARLAFATAFGPPVWDRYFAVNSTPESVFHEIEHERGTVR